MTEPSSTPPILKNKKVLIIGGAVILLIVVLLSLAAIFLSPPSKEDYRVAANDLRDTGTAYNELFKYGAFSRSTSTLNSEQITERTKDLEESYAAYTTASDRLTDLKAWRNDEVGAAYEPFKAADEKVRDEYAKVLDSYPHFAKILTTCVGNTPLPPSIRTQEDVTAFKEDYKECTPALEKTSEITFEPYKKFADRIKKYNEDLTALYTDMANTPREDYMSRITLSNSFYSMRSEYNKDIRELSATPEFATELTRAARALQKELDDKIAETK